MSFVAAGAEHPRLQPGINFIQKLAQFDVKMQLNTALTLLYVARHQNRPEGVTHADLMRWLGVSTASVSRNLYYWEEGGEQTPNAGYNLIEIKRDIKDRRRRVLCLTPRGEAFINQLEEILDG